jgi:hypothetical protein
MPRPDDADSGIDRNHGEQAFDAMIGWAMGAIGSGARRLMGG